MHNNLWRHCGLLLADVSEPFVGRSDSIEQFGGKETQRSDALLLAVK